MNMMNIQVTEQEEQETIEISTASLVKAILLDSIYFKKKLYLFVGERIQHIINYSRKFSLKCSSDDPWRNDCSSIFLLL